MRNKSDIIDKYKIKLSQYLSGNCPYGGCKHNEMGYCSSEDEEFLDNIHISANEDLNETIDCNPNIPYGVCEFCGKELKEYIEWHPYGDTSIPMKTWYCECD